MVAPTGFAKKRQSQYSVRGVDLIKNKVTKSVIKKLNFKISHFFKMIYNFFNFILDLAKVRDQGRAAKLKNT